MHIQNVSTYGHTMSRTHPYISNAIYIHINIYIYIYVYMHAISNVSFPSIFFNVISNPRNPSPWPAGLFDRILVSPTQGAEAPQWVDTPKNHIQLKAQNGPGKIHKHLSPPPKKKHPPNQMPIISHIQKQPTLPETNLSL